MRERIKLFLIIFLGSLFLTLFSYFGTEAYGNVFLAEKNFDEETTIGPINVGQLSEDEAINKIYEQIEQWKQAPTITLTYADHEHVFSSDLYYFFVEESVQTAVNGSNNPLSVLVKETDLNNELASIKNETGLHDIKLEQLKADLESHATQLPRTETKLKLIDYLNGDEKELKKTFGHVNLSISNGNMLKTWTKNYKVIVIPAKKSVSLLETIEKNKGTFSNDFLSRIASGIYEVALHTNLEIIERNKSKEYPNGVKEGYEARVVKGKMDFVLLNPNDTDLTIKFANNGNNVTIAIEGIDYGYSYEPEVERGETLRARTVVEYVSEPKSNVTGKDGFSLSTYQNVYNANGGLIDYKHVAEDVYLPVHHIEYRMSLSLDNEVDVDNDDLTALEEQWIDNGYVEENQEEILKIQKELETLHQIIAQLKENENESGKSNADEIEKIQEEINSLKNLLEKLNAILPK